MRYIDCSSRELRCHRSAARRARGSLIVLDASAAVEPVLRTPRATWIDQRLLDPLERLHAPELIDIEVTQVLRCLLHARELTLMRAEEAFSEIL